jgi:O-antigen ligase
MSSIAAVQTEMKLESARLGRVTVVATVFFLLVACVMAAVKINFFPGWLAFIILMVIALSLNRDRLFVATLCLVPFGALTVPGFPLSLSVIYVPALLALLFEVGRREGRWQKYIGIALLIYFAVMIISVVQTYIFSSLTPPEGVLDPKFGIRASRHRGWYQIVAQLLLVWLSYYMHHRAQTPRGLRKAIRWILAISLPAAAFGIYEFIAKFTGLPLVFFSFDAPEYVSKAVLETSLFQAPRVYGTSIEPAYYGNFLLIPFSLCLALLLLHSRPSRLTKYAGWLLPVVVCSLFLTFSTGAWAAAIVVLASILILARMRGIALAVIAGLLVTSASVLLPSNSLTAYVPAIAQTHVSKVENSLVGWDARGIGRARAIEIAEQFPILGVGLGNEPLWMANSNLELSSYNIFLAQLSEMGIIGFVSFLLLIIVLARSLYSGYQTGGSSLAGVFSAACLAAFMGMLTSHMSWASRLMPSEWLMLGLGCGAARLAHLARAPHRNRAQARIPSSVQW